MGICGTAMASLAGIFKHEGYIVTGSDQNVYPPMSQFLEELSIPVLEGYRAENLHPAPNLVIVGNVIAAGTGQGLARQISIKAGIPAEVPAYGLNMVCGSGMKTIMNAFAGIKAGLVDIVVAGGVESMSQAPFIVSGKLRDGNKMGDMTMSDAILLDALTDAFGKMHMGITAENIAAKHGISREEQDAFSLTSQIKAIAAVDAGVFDGEIVPIEIKTKKETLVFARDEYPNRTTNAEKLAKLRPAFKPDGSVTAGTSSGINDGASFTVIASEDAVKKYNLKPLVELIAVGQGGVDPNFMGLGPVPAIKNVLKAAGLTLDDIEEIELNEAFAAQSLGVVTELVTAHGVDKNALIAKTNLHGGAIALGHPVGMSGNRIVVTLIHDMIKNGKKLGLASLCIGGGMGTAVIVRRV